MLGDQPQEFGRVEPRHQHQVWRISRPSSPRSCRCCGSAAPTPGGCRPLGRPAASRQSLPYTPVAAGLDQLRPAGAAAGRHRLPRRRHRLGQRRSERPGSGVKSTGTLGISLPSGQRAAPAAAAPASPRTPPRATAGTAAGGPRRASRPRPRPGSTRWSWAGDGDVVADADAALGVGAGQPVGRAVEFAAGEGPPVAGDRRLVGRERGQPGNCVPIGGTASVMSVRRPGARRSFAGCRPAWCGPARR